MARLLTKDNRRLNSLLDEVERIRQRDSLSVADVARAIGKEGNYNQVYNWLVTRSHEPKAEVALVLIGFCANGLNNAKFLALLRGLVSVAVNATTAEKPQTKNKRN